MDHHLKATDQFQSTLPQGERPDIQQNARLILDVSIHAPAGGATIEIITTGNFKRFNPRSRRGSDYAVSIWPGILEFQSTLPQGERLGEVPYVLPFCDVSIHAPAGGATYYFVRTARSCCSFNPRSRRGSD